MLRRRKTKQNHKTICVGHHYAQANSNNVNKIWAPLQTIEGKDEQYIVWMRTGDSERKYTAQTILHTYVGNINLNILWFISLTDIFLFFVSLLY
jgi:hypothetical protein